MEHMTCHNCQGVLMRTNNKRPKIMGRALLIKVLLPISVVILFVYYYSSGFPCFLQSFRLSFVATLNHVISKKAFFLLSNLILLLLSIDFNINLRGSCAFMNNVCDEYLMRFRNHLPSEFYAIEDEPVHVVKKKIIEMEQSFANNIYDGLLMRMQDDRPPFYERLYGGGAINGVGTLDVSQVERDANYQLRQGWLALDDQPSWQPNSIEAEDVEEKDTVKSVTALDVVVVKEVITEEANLVRRKDEFDLLSIDELNHMFEEFIKREKRKRSLEALQLVMV